MDLSNKNISYMIISSNKIDDIMSVLWAKEYQIIPIKEYYKGNYTDSIIAYSPKLDNEDIKKEILFILDHFNVGVAILKYKGENTFNQIYNNGSEKPMSISMYNSDLDKKSYLYEGFLFSFIEEKRYWMPKNKEDLKAGMIVEYFNNGKWFKQEVKNPSDEYDRFYKLLIKYDKLRVAI